MQGKVTKVFTNSNPGKKTYYRVMVEGQDKGLSSLDATVLQAEGRVIDYAVQVNGNFKNLAEGWSYADDGPSSAPAAGNSLPRAENTGRDASIIRQYSYREAIQFVRLGIDTEQIKLPKTGKNTGIAYLRALVKEEAARIYEHVSNHDGWGVAEADAYVPDPDPSTEE